MRERKRERARVTRREGEREKEGVAERVRKSEMFGMTHQALFFVALQPYWN